MSVNFTYFVIHQDCFSVQGEKHGRNYSVYEGAKWQWYFACPAAGAILGSLHWSYLLFMSVSIGPHSICTAICNTKYPIWPTIYQVIYEGSIYYTLQFTKWFNSWSNFIPKRSVGHQQFEFGSLIYIYPPKKSQFQNPGILDISSVSGANGLFSEKFTQKDSSFTYRIHVKYSYHIFTLQCITLNKCTLHLLPVTLCLYSFGRFHGGRHQVFPTRCRKPLESCPRPPVPLPCEGWKGSGSEKVKVVKYHPTVGFPKNRAFPKNHPHKKKHPSLRVVPYVFVWFQFVSGYVRIVLNS